MPNAARLAVVPLYAMVASRVGRVRLVTGVMLFFASNLGIFILFGRMGLREGVTFCVWVGACQ